MVSGVGIYGDQAAGQIHVPRAKEMLRLLKHRAQLGGISTLSTIQKLDPDGTYCYAVVAGGVERAVIVPGSSSQPEASAATPPQGNIVIPDFYSGVISNGYLTTDPLPLLQSFRPTTACGKKYGVATGNTAHLATDQGDTYAPISFDPALGLNNTQYSNLKATMFSGRMRGLVQVLMGSGKQLLDASSNPTSKLPKAQKSIADQLPKSAYQLSVDAHGLVIKYNPSFTSTDGIGTGADGKLWLVNLQSSGVIAMPLPLHYDTTLPNYRAALLKAGFVDALEVIDAFGGLPTGEPFPTNNPDPWVRAGRVIKATGDLTVFYTGTGPSGFRREYGEKIGWAFNRSGTEAHNCVMNQSNVGTTYTASSVHGKVNWVIGAMTEVVLKKSTLSIKTQFATLRGSIDDDVLDAAIWKLDRLSADQIAETNFQLLFSPGDAVTYVDGLVLAPLATITATYTEVSSDVLPDVNTNMIMLTPEVVSAAGVMRRLAVLDNVGARDSDTTVFAYFIGDALQTVNYKSTHAFGDPHDQKFYGTQFDPSWDSSTISDGDPSGFGQTGPHQTIFQRICISRFDREGFIYEQQITTHLGRSFAIGLDMRNPPPSHHDMADSPLSHFDPSYPPTKYILDIDTVDTSNSVFGTLATGLTGNVNTPIIIYQDSFAYDESAVTYTAVFDYTDGVDHSSDYVVGGPPSFYYTYTGPEYSQYTDPAHSNPGAPIVTNYAAIIAAQHPPLYVTPITNDGYGCALFELTGNVFGAAVSIRVSKALQIRKTATYGGDDFDAWDVVNLGTLSFGSIPWAEISEDIAYYRPAYPQVTFFYKTATYVGVIDAP